MGSNGIVNEAGPLCAIEGRVRNMNPYLPIIWINFYKVESQTLLNMSDFFVEKVCGKEPDFWQSDESDLLHDDIVSSVSWSFPGFELNKRV